MKYLLRGLLLAGLVLPVAGCGVISSFVKDNPVASMLGAKYATIYYIDQQPDKKAAAISFLEKLDIFEETAAVTKLYTLSDALELFLVVVDFERMSALKQEIVKDALALATSKVAEEKAPDIPAEIGQLIRFARTGACVYVACN